MLIFETNVFDICGLPSAFHLLVILMSWVGSRVNRHASVYIFPLARVPHKLEHGMIRKARLMRTCRFQHPLFKDPLFEHQLFEHQLYALTKYGNV